MLTPLAFRVLILQALKVKLEPCCVFGGAVLPCRSSMFSFFLFPTKSLKEK